MEERREIARRIEILFKLADKIEKRIEAATKRANKLTQSVVAKAFRGELVATEAELARREGRDYEPASALLERIKVHRKTCRPSFKCYALSRNVPKLAETLVANLMHTAGAIFVKVTANFPEPCRLSGDKPKCHIKRTAQKAKSNRFLATHGAGVAVRRSG